MPVLIMPDSLKYNIEDQQEENTVKCFLFITILLSGCAFSDPHSSECLKIKLRDQKTILNEYNHGGTCNSSPAENLNIFVEKILQISVEKNSLIALASFKNISSNAIYILKDRPNIYIYLNNEPIDYIGVTYKRSEPTIDDYQKIPPKGKTLRKFDITNDFDFKQGLHTYKAVFNGGYVDPIKNVFFYGKSKTIFFNYKTDKKPIHDN
jgi:hypothetical protein